MQTDLPDILAQYAPNTPSYKEKFGANTNRQKSCIKELSDYFLKSCLTSTVCINFAILTYLPTWVCKIVGG